MKVKDLIKQLQELNPELPIVGQALIESGRSLDISINGGVSIEEDDDFGYYDEEEDEDIHLGHVVLLNYQGDRTSSQ
jgi:hypothetical protein